MKELFSKTLFPNLAMALQHGFLNWRLVGFGKEVYIYIGNVYGLYILDYTKRVSQPKANITLVCHANMMTNAKDK